jgi:hypothetical protein
VLSIIAHYVFATLQMEAQDVQVTLKFLQWQPLYETEKPFQIFIDIPDDAEDKRNTNLVFEDVPLKVQDVRALGEIRSIDEKGFIYRKHKSSVSNFSNRKSVDETYLPEIEVLLRSQLDEVDRVFFFDWRVSGTHCASRQH